MLIKTIVEKKEVDNLQAIICDFLRAMYLIVFSKIYYLRKIITQMNK